MEEVVLLTLVSTILSVSALLVSIVQVWRQTYNDIEVLISDYVKEGIRFELANAGKNDISLREFGMYSSGRYFKFPIYDYSVLYLRAGSSPSEFIGSYQSLLYFDDYISADENIRLYIKTGEKYYYSRIIAENKLEKAVTLIKKLNETPDYNIGGKHKFDKFPLRRKQSLDLRYRLFVMSQKRKYGAYTLELIISDKVRDKGSYVILTGPERDVVVYSEVGYIDHHGNPHRLILTHKLDLNNPDMYVFEMPQCPLNEITGFFVRNSSIVYYRKCTVRPGRFCIDLKKHKKESRKDCHPRIVYDNGLLKLNYCADKDCISFISVLSEKGGVTDGVEMYSVYDYSEDSELILEINKTLIQDGSLLLVRSWQGKVFSINTKELEKSTKVLEMIRCTNRHIIRVVNNDYYFGSIKNNGQS